MGNITLCGFMGCGKSTVAPLLAQMLGMQTVDMDVLIEQQEGRTISSIFAKEGETAFRDIESAMCKKLSLSSNLIISAGGGAVLREQNVQALRSNGGVIVLLDVPKEILIERLRGDTTRPLLAKDDLEATITRLMAARMPIYRACADIIVDASQTPHQVARAIAQDAGK